MEELTAFQRDVLYVVAGLNEPHGPAIKDELEKYYKNEVKHGRHYPNLNILVEKGLVKKGLQDGRTNFYELTSQGHRKIEARRKWENKYVTLEV